MAYDTQGGDTQPDPSGSGIYVGRDGHWYDQFGNDLGASGQAAAPAIAHQPVPLTHPTASGGTTTTSGVGMSTTDPNYWSNLSTGIFGAMPTIPQAPAFHYDAFNAPAPYALPSGEDVLKQDPGYQFRLDQGTGAIQHSAAARGVLNTGGTLKDLLNYGQSAGSQEYSNAADRSLNTYQTNFSDALNAWLANAGNAFNTYNTNYSTQYQNPYLAAMGQYQQKVGNQGQLFGQQLSTATG